MNIITNGYDHELLAQNLIAFRRTMWNEMLVSVIANSSNPDISITQVATLVLLAGGEHLTIKRVAELLGRSVSATSRILDQLVTRGLVRRYEDERDRRAKRVALSESGRDFVQGIEQKRVEAQMAVMAYLSPEERAIVAQAMQLLAIGARRHADEHAKSKATIAASSEE